MPYAAFARWWAAWRRQGKRGLPDRPKRPRHRPTALQGRVLDIIRQVHRQLGLGVRSLHAYLIQAGLISCSLSSVYRVLKRAGALVLHPRKPKPVWPRYAKALPGERGQMDLMYLPEGRYQLTLVDDCSRLLAAAVCSVVPRLLRAFPFSFRCIQADNGSEFGRALTFLLRRLGIRHARIRPCSPHVNGKVERAQRTVQEEYWDGVGPGPVEEWERGLQDYLRFYNRRRLHGAHGVCFAAPAPGPDLSRVLKHYN